MEGSAISAALKRLEMRIRKYQEALKESEFAGSRSGDDIQSIALTKGEVETVETLIINFCKIRTNELPAPALWEPLHAFTSKNEDKKDNWTAQQIEYLRWALMWVEKTRTFLACLDGLGDPPAASNTQEKEQILLPKERAVPVPAARKVFVVHGHDEGVREAVARFLERIGFEAIILHEQANLGRTIMEKIEAHGDVGFAIVLLTPDDVGSANGGVPQPRARQNVLLELGYFIGRLGRSRVCALKRGEVEIPSDFGGVVYEPFDASEGWKLALSRELTAAGFEVDWNKVHVKA